MNQAGKIVGRAETSTGMNHAFLYTPGKGASGSATFQDLGTLTTGGSSVAMSVNDGDHVAGYATASGGFTHAFLWTAAGGMIDLHNPGIVGSSFALGVNAADVVVGRIDLLGGISRAFIWTVSTGMLDLNSLLAPDSGWYLTSATGINSNGEIVGYGTYKGQLRGYVLASGFGGGGASPLITPEPTSLVLFGLGAVGLFLSLKRRNGIAKPGSAPQTS